MHFIGLDLMGGDYAPQAPLEGVQRALDDLPDDCTLVLYGEENIIRKEAPEEVLSSKKIKLVHCQEVIDMGESPTKAIMKKRDSSISVGLRALKSGEIDLFISAGNTGAILVGAMYSVKAAEGVIRPAIASIVPKIDGTFGVMLDVGANPDCKPDVLYQFGILGSLYSKYVLGVDDPRIGLLNIGAEAEKGNLATQAAYNIFENSSKVNFIGNVEGYDVFTQKADVLVCDGFVGNVLLKTAESLYKIFGSRMKEDAFIERFDYEYYGATPILGINKPVLIGHGVSSPKAFTRMFKQAVDILDSRLIEKVKTTFEP